MDISQFTGPHGLILYPENREIMRRGSSRPAWPLPDRVGLGLHTVIFMIILGVFLYLAIPAWRGWLHMRNDGTVITGRLLSAETTRDIMWVEYEYVYNNQYYTNRQKLYARDFDAIVAQVEHIQIRVLPDDPRQATVEDFRSEDNRLLIPLTIGGVVFVLFILWPLVAGLNERDQKILLAKKGRTVRGEILQYTVKDLTDTAGCMNAAARSLGGLVGLKLLSAYHRSQAKRAEREKKRARGIWKSEVRYKFTSPSSGKVIEKKETITWNEEGDLPLDVPSGTPVAIYYRTDRHFRLL